MDEYLEIEAILNEIDFSRGRKEAVWEKIKLCIKNDEETTFFNKGDDRFYNDKYNLAGLNNYTMINNHILMESKDK